MGEKFGRSRQRQFMLGFTKNNDGAVWRALPAPLQQDRKNNDFVLITHPSFCSKCCYFLWKPFFFSIGEAGILLRLFFNSQPSNCVHFLIFSDQKAALYNNIATTAASGLDFSCKWLKKCDQLNSSRASHVLPVELNSYICGNARLLSFFFEKVGRCGFC